VPVLGTLVHTLTFPLIAMALIFAANFIGLGTSDATVMGILLIAACPSGGFSNVLALMAKVNLPLSVMLTVVSSLGSFLTVPLLMGGFGLLVAELQEPVRLPVVQTLVQLFLLVVLPIAVGMGLRRTKPLWVDQHMARL
jgi:BASS family bile acid:Na+ symporter